MACATCCAKNADDTRRVEHRLENKLAKLHAKIAARNGCVEHHTLAHMAELKLRERQIVASIGEGAKRDSLELAGCYVLVSGVPKGRLTAQLIHAGCMALENVERDFRTMKTGLLEVRPIFGRKESRMRGHVFCCMLALRLQREVERRLAAVFGTTDADRHTLTLAGAIAALSRLSLLHCTVNETAAATTLPLPAK
jgi:hypothetical protein